MYQTAEFPKKFIIVAIHHYSPPTLTPINLFSSPSFVQLFCLHHIGSSYGAPNLQPAAVFEQSYDLPTPESYLSTANVEQEAQNHKVCNTQSNNELH